MIKINKCQTPKILVDNQAVWTKSLIDAVNSYGGYSHIPKSEKESLLSHYRHKDIQEALSKSSFCKCAFCESKVDVSGYMEVEHLAPKSIYPQLAFNWDNLLPACRKCNASKSAYDTVTEPIIDPSKLDPEMFLTYDCLPICPKENPSGTELAQRTIEECDLNRTSLYEARASLLKALTEYMDELKDKMDEIREADTPRKQKIRLTKLRNSIEKVEMMLNDDRLYAGYCRWFVGKSREYKEAKKMLSESTAIT